MAKAKAQAATDTKVKAKVTVTDGPSTRSKSVGGTTKGKVNCDVSVGLDPYLECIPKQESENSEDTDSDSDSDPDSCTSASDYYSESSLEGKWWGSARSDTSDPDSDEEVDSLCAHLFLKSPPKSALTASGTKVTKVKQRYTS